MSDTLELLDTLVQKALTLGADAADAVAIDARSKAISVREGKLEDVDASEGQDIGLRVLIGTKQAITSSSNRSPKALTEMLERTIEMARGVPDDPYCGLAPADKLAGPSDLALQDTLELLDTTDLSADTLRDMCLEAEAEARAVKGVTNSNGASASASRWSIALATSHGFRGTYGGSSFSVSASAVAGSGTAMERDYDFSSTRHAADLASPALIGRAAGEKAVKRLGATSFKSGRMPVVFDPRVAGSLVGHFIGAVNGAAIARGSSFLKDMMGEQVFAPSVTILDDPHRVRGLKSRLFDGEGVRTRLTHLAEDGVLKTWMLNSAAARQLGLEVTGHASRSAGSTPGISGSNIYMAAGSLPPSELISDIETGIYVTELIGMGVNGVTGDYSRGAAGFLIEKGEITRPVNEITIAGNLKDMYKAMTPANDLTFKYGLNAPTVRIDAVTIAGN